jgi:hypothetical protein
VKKQTEEEQLKAYIESVDTSGIDIDPEDLGGGIRSKFFTDAEIEKLPRYTKEELDALPEPWTKRGEMLEVDKVAVRSLSDRDTVAARIFITGEAAISYIGKDAAAFLMGVNDSYIKGSREPLFAYTKEQTIRMTRFDPWVAWRNFHPDLLIELLEAEIDRVGIDMDPWQMDFFDFYQNMIAAIKARNCGETLAVVKHGSSAELYHGIYLACLLLFGKPGYMDVPVASHFAREEAVHFLHGVELYQLNKAAVKELQKLKKKYGGIKFLTGQELEFVIDLYESASPEAVNRVL